MSTTFTSGKDQYFENFMQKPPYKRDKVASNNRAFHYTLADLDCDVCTSKKGCDENALCPHIMENLDDLTQDSSFAEAIASAENCDNKQKFTLLFLREQSIPKNVHS